MSPATAPLPAPVSTRFFLPQPGLAAALFLSACLVACGGTGGGGISANADGEILLTAREATLVSGTLESVKYRIKDMQWSVIPLASSNPTLFLQNQTCALAQRQDLLAPTPATSTLPAGSGSSSWRCTLMVYAEENIPVDALYELLLTGTNEAGQQISYRRTLRLKPNTSLSGIDPDEAYLKDLTINPVATVCQPGAPIRLQASGIDTTDPGFYYRWRILQGPEIVLAGENTPTVGFITPQTAALTWVELEVSRSPLTSESSTRFKARAVVSTDPAYPQFVCSSIQNNG